MAISEYDAFGPWIYEIDEEHPLPELFKNHFPESENYLMLFKIPCEIERRLATPDMDLYDCVVGATENGIHIATRENHSVTHVFVAYTDICGVRLFRRFLHGVCTLYTSTKSVTFIFNAVSMEIVQRLVKMIRTRYLCSKTKTLAISPTAEDSVPEVLFVNLLKDLRNSGEQISLGAYQLEIPVELKEGSLLTRISHKLHPRNLTRSLHLFSDKELIIIQSGEDIKERDTIEYGYDYTYIPFDSIQNISASDSERYHNICKYQIHLESDSFTYHIAADNKKCAAFYDQLKHTLQL